MIKAFNKKILAVVVTYNRKELLCECLEALLHQECSFLVIFIVDNASTDGKHEYIEKYLPASIPNIINEYTSDILNNILLWVYVICMAVFLGYTIRYFISKK